MSLINHIHATGYRGNPEKRHTSWVDWTYSMTAQKCSILSIQEAVGMPAGSDKRSRGVPD